MKKLQIIPFALFAMALTVSAQTTYLWTNLVSGSASGSWGTAAAWDPAGPAAGTDNTAQFTLPLTNNVAGTTIALNGNRTIGNLTFGNTSSSNLGYTISTGTVANASLTLDVSSGTPILNVTNQSVTFLGPVVSSLGFIKTGAGTLTFNNTNNFGTVSNSVAAGIVTLNSLTALPAGSVVGVTSGAGLTVPLAGTYNSNAVTISGAGTGGSGPGALRFGGGGNAIVTWPAEIALNGNATISSYGVGYVINLNGPVVGAGNLTLGGTGGSVTSHSNVFNLNNRSSFSGNTTFAHNGGLLSSRLMFGTNNALPTTTALSINNGNANTVTLLDLKGFSQTLAKLTLNGTLATVTELLTNSSASIPTLNLSTNTGTAFSVNAGTNYLNNLTLTVGGSGDAATTIGVGATTVLNVSNVTWNSSFYTDLGRSASTVINLYNGTTLNNSGELLMGYGNAAAVSTLNVNTGAVINAHYLRVGNNASSTLNLNAGATVTGDEVYGYTTISNALNWNGALLQPNSSLFVPWIAATLTNVQVQSGGAIVNTLGRNPVIAAVLLAGSPSGGLTKLGAGTLTLSGIDNSYTGSTVVSNGTLAVDGNLIASPVTLATVAGATPALSGNGFVPAANINSGTYLNPGRTNLAGTLTVSNLTTAAGGTLSFDLSNSGATIGSGVNDLLVTTNLNLAATTTVGLNFLAGYPGAADRYVLATYSGSASGLANLALDPALVGTRAAMGIDTSTAGEIAVVLTNGTTPSTLTWYGNNPNNNWDRTTVLNWNSGADQFFNADNVVFDDSAQTSTVNLVGSLYPATVTFNNSGPYKLTGSGQIGGATALTLNGGGTVIINANSFNNSGGVILNGGNTLQIGNADTAGAIGSGDVQFLNSSSTLNYNRTDALTLNNRIYGSSGVNPLIQVNSGTLTLAGATDNSFAIATVNTGGTLVLGKTSGGGVRALGGAGTALTINTGGIAKLGGTGGDQVFDGRDVQDDGTLDLAGLNETINNLMGSGIVTNSAVGNSVLSVGSGNATVAYGGLIVDGPAGTVGLTTLGAGSVTLTTANTATGPLTLVGSGSVYLSNVTAPAWSGPVVFTNTSGRLMCEAINQLAANSVIYFGGSTAGRVELNGFNQICGGVTDFAGVSGNRIIEAASDNTPGLPGTLIVNVATGITNSSGCYVRDAAGSSAGSILSLIKTGAGTQTFSGSAGLVNISGATTVSNGVLEVSGANSVLANSAITLAGGTMKFSGGGTRATPIEGNGTLQVGAGTFITTASNTYTGNTFVSGGTLQLGDGTINGSIRTDVTNNGVFKISVATNTVQTYAGVISGTGSFTKDVFGTLYLNGVNTFTNSITINAGALWINNSQSLGLGTKTVNLANGTAGHPELHLNATNGNIILSAASSLSTSWAGTPVIQNEAGNNVINGSINLTSGGGDTYIAVNGGTLTLAGGISPSQANRNLILGGLANGTVSGVISNGTQVLNSLRKLDAGTWTLSGANTFTGPTTVEAGTIFVNGSLNTNTLTVFTNATLGGNGLILGAVTVQGSAVLAPGTASLGTLTISNNLTMNSASTNLFRVNAATTTNDSVAGVNTLTYGGTLIVSNTGGAFTAGQSFKLFNATTINPATFASVRLPALTGTLVWTNQLAASGTIAVISTASVATNQVPITFNVTGSSLNLSWPPDHLGWKLQSQTNTVASGLGTNWVTILGTDTVTNKSITVDALKGSVFFRLIYP